MKMKEEKDEEETEKKRVIKDNSKKSEKYII